MQRQIILMYHIFQQSLMSLFSFFFFFFSYFALTIHRQDQLQARLRRDTAISISTYLFLNANFYPLI